MPAFRNFLKLRSLSAANFLCQRAAGVEVAAGGRVKGRWYLAYDRFKDPLALIQSKGLGQQCFGVRVAGICENFFRWRALDDTAQIHDSDAVCDMLHKVLSDE